MNPADDRFHAEAQDELRQVREQVYDQRKTLLQITLTTATDHRTREAALARMWLLGTVESALWRIEARLKGDTFA